MSRLNHTFSVEHAEKYGIECAILIHHFQFWIEQNQSLERNFHEGRTWMYQTQKEISSIFSYLSEDSVFRILKKLEDFEVIIKGNFNKTGFDKTIWYAFKNEEIFTKPRNRGMDTAILRNRSHVSAEPIPDVKTNREQKQQQQKQPAAVFFECLKEVDIPESEKTRISKKYPEDDVKHAVLFAIHPSTVIKKGLVQTIKWACEFKPEIPKNKTDLREENKQEAEKILEKSTIPSTCYFEVLNKEVEIGYCAGQAAPTVIEYIKDGFSELLKMSLNKYQIKYST